MLYMVHTLNDSHLRRISFVIDLIKSQLSCQNLLLEGTLQIKFKNFSKVSFNTLQRSISQIWIMHKP